jgi:hypothetical protein
MGYGRRVVEQVREVATRVAAGLGLQVFDVEFDTRRR